MNLKPEELVKALRCTSTPGKPTGDCEMCPYYRRENLNDELKEKLGTDTWTSCDIDKVGMDAADQIERDQKVIDTMKAKVEQYRALIPSCVISTRMRGNGAARWTRRRKETSMSKAVLISIRPEWCEKIINGQKTIEVRKTRPKMDTPFKVYIYCTSGRPDLNIPISPERLMQDYLDTGSMQSLNCPLGNGKVIGEFTCDRIDEYDDDTIFSFRHEDYARWNDFDLYRACMHPEDFQNYANGKWLYGWHISNLKIYDTQRELREFYAVPNEVEVALKVKPKPVTRPPQSWRYVEEELWND